MNLEIESVKFKNFLTFGSRIQEVPFLKGLNLVTGMDIDRKRSNGAGKSSFLEAVPFALFGQVHRDIKKKQIINWKNRKNCEVVLDFKIGDDNYNVLRAIKPDNFEIYKNNTLIDKPSHVRDYQVILEDIIGLNFKTFMSLIHSNINSSAKILTMSKPEKRKLIDLMFGLTVYKSIQEYSNKKLRGISDGIREIDITSSSNLERIDDLKSTIEDLEYKASKKPYQYTQLKEKEEELSEIKEEYDEIKDELSEKRTLLTEKESNIKYFDAIQDNISKRLYKINVNLDNIDERIKKGKEFEEIEYKNEHNKSRLKDLEDIYGNIDTIEKLLSETNKEITETEKNVNETKNEIDTIEREISRLEKDGVKSADKIQKLEDNICPTCNQQISDESILKKEEINLKSIGLKLQELIEKRKKLLNRHYNTKLKIPNLIETRNELDILRKDIRSIKIIEIQYPDDIDKLKKDKLRYGKTHDRLSDLNINLKSDMFDVQKTVSLLTESVENLQGKITKAYDLEQDIERLKEFVELEKSNQKEIKSLIDSNKKKMDTLIEKNSTSSTRKKTLMSLKDYTSLIKEICKDENIKQYAISSIMPYINERANHYLSKVNYSFYVIIDKWLEMQVKGPGVTDASYGSLSGGESRGIDIAIQLAFLDISKLRASIFPDFLTFDELLDTSIDGAGISQLFKIVRLKQRKDESKVFIISHRSELDEMSDVDNVYHVEKSGGYSKVRIL